MMAVAMAYEEAMAVHIADYILDILTPCLA
jgi:hypothetical protein